VWQQEKSADYANGSSRVDCQIGKNSAHKFLFYKTENDFMAAMR
jgi:hypothetical protein